MRRVLLALSIGVTTVAIAPAMGTFVQATPPVNTGPPVVIRNTTANSVPVRTVPAVADLVNLQMVDFCGINSELYTVPAGKVLVIEDVNGNLGTADADRREVGVLAQNPELTEERFYGLPVTLQRSIPLPSFSLDEYSGHELMRVYVPAGWTIEAFNNCLPTDTGGVFVVVVNGHLVDVAG